MGRQRQAQGASSNGTPPKKVSEKCRWDRGAQYYRILRMVPDGPQVQFWNLIRCHLYLAVSNEKNSNPAMILTRSTILISNRPLEEWGKLIGGVPAASAILDRFVHHAHIIKIKRTSYQLLILIELPVGVGTY